MQDKIFDVLIVVPYAFVKLVHVSKTFINYQLNLKYEIVI